MSIHKSGNGSDHPRAGTCNWPSWGSVL